MSCIFYHVYHGFVGWGGVGWDDNVHVTRDAQRTAMFDVMFVHADIGTQCYVDGWGGGWGGVRWGGMITFMLRVMHNALRC